MTEHHIGMGVWVRPMQPNSDPDDRAEPTDRPPRAHVDDLDAEGVRQKLRASGVDEADFEVRLDRQNGYVRVYLNAGPLRTAGLGHLQVTGVTVEGDRNGPPIRVDLSPRTSTVEVDRRTLAELADWVHPAPDDPVLEIAPPDSNIARAVRDAYRTLDCPEHIPEVWRVDGGASDAR